MHYSAAVIINLVPISGCLDASPAWVGPVNDVTGVVWLNTVVFSLKLDIVIVFEYFRALSTSVID